ncbi:transglycosylase family protein [Pseudonocardia acidicola]|uniref:LysM peptidoglycan-binding domain-containing protein n=1 Tax=Pseudonocardia acidicola TaxID=2724939 RepID=A0ABX1SMD3_9PSEU|nr:transglycosylase family protein [Pseudonocardia acidicola]NMI02241.1 LysM peptidoglycan-binding domain-containing protein [Pseudonocardia acidicola]
MPRYRGRHRKATKTGRVIAGTALAGAVAGAPFVIAAPAANAATDATWDRVAQCESSGNWSINTGNGFQGGLQFTPSTWAGFGGAQFAPSANLATRDQQITVAERVLAVQGWGAWPVCSVKAGATGEGVTPRSITASAPAPAAAPAPQRAPAPAPAAAPKAASAPMSRAGHVVKAGDTLSAIAAAHGMTLHALLAKNPMLAGNPNLIFPGQHVAL